MMETRASCHQFLPKRSELSETRYVINNLTKTRWWRVFLHQMHPFPLILLEDKSKLFLLNSKVPKYLGIPFQGLAWLSTIRHEPVIVSTHNSQVKNQSIRYHTVYLI